MLKTIAITLAVLLLLAAAAIVLLAWRKPDAFRVERSIAIQAPPERIFPLISDLRRWSAWSPYEKKDPAMKRSFSGAASGQGAVYAWEGNAQVGQGRMEVTAAQPFSRVSIQLDFIKPFEAHNIAEFTLSPDGAGGTRVSWAMQGPASLVTKTMQVLLDFDQMIGGDFEDGLKALKAEAEKQA